MMAAPYQDNLYFAALPPRAVETAMERMWGSVGTADAFRHGKLHLTLLGVAPWRAAARSVEALTSRVPALRTGAFDLLFDHLATFGGGERGWALALACDARCSQPTNLARELRAALWSHPLFMGKQTSVTPHVTLAYGAPIPQRFLPSAIHWHVDEIWLVHNHVGRNRPLERLARWALPEKPEPVQPELDFG